jgi:hypothetical protein
MNKCTVHIMVQVEHRVWKGETNPHILIMHMAIICTTAVRIEQIQWGFEHGRLPQPVDVDASVANLRLLYLGGSPSPTNWPLSLRLRYHLAALPGDLLSIAPHPAPPRGSLSIAPHWNAACSSEQISHHHADPLRLASITVKNDKNGPFW